MVSQFAQFLTGDGGEDVALKLTRCMEKQVALRRCKLVVAGEQRVGKTSLVKALLGLEFDCEQQSTDGIRVEGCRVTQASWTIRGSSGSSSFRQGDDHELSGFVADAARSEWETELQSRQAAATAEQELRKAAAAAEQELRQAAAAAGRGDLCSVQALLDHQPGSGQLDQVRFAAEVE